MAAMLGVASGRVLRSFEIKEAKATNGQKNGSAEESNPVQREYQLSTNSGHYCPKGRIVANAFAIKARVGYYFIRSQFAMLTTLYVFCGVSALSLLLAALRH